MNKIITIHQIEHLPWLGLLDKLSKADEFVLLDTVDFEKNYFQNRNKIRTKEGWNYLTIPIEKHNHKPLKDVLVSSDNKWKEKYLGILYNAYHNATYFRAYYPYIKNIIEKNYTHLIDYNKDLFYYFLNWFNIKKSFYFSSQLEIDHKFKSTDLLVEICKKLNAITYLSGTSGQNYLDLEQFKQANINVKFHNFFHPVYKQCFNPFIPGLSALDLLMNYGDNAKNVIKGKGIGALELILNSYDLHDKKILEMFSGDGSGHLKSYINNANHIDAWELDKNKCLELISKNCYVTNCDSLKEMKKECWHNYFDVLILDPPAFMSEDLIIPEALKLLKEEGIIIFRNIIKSFNNNPKVKSDKTLEEWDKIIGEFYTIKHRYAQPREYYFLDLWLENLVYELRKK